MNKAIKRYLKYKFSLTCQKLYNKYLNDRVKFEKELFKKYPIPKIIKDVAEEIYNFKGVRK